MEVRFRLALLDVVFAANEARPAAVVHFLHIVLDCWRHFVSVTVQRATVLEGVIADVALEQFHLVLIQEQRELIHPSVLRPDFALHELFQDVFVELRVECLPSLLEKTETLP